MIDAHRFLSTFPPSLFLREDHMSYICDSTDVHLAFPAELERTIFEVAAHVRSLLIPTFMLVAWRVKIRLVYCLGARVIHRLSRTILSLLVILHTVAIVRELCSQLTSSLAIHRRCENYTLGVPLGRKSLDQHCGWRYTFPDRGFAVETAVLQLGKPVSPPAN